MLRASTTTLAKKIETATQAKHRRVHAREITRLRHVRAVEYNSCTGRAGACMLQRSARVLESGCQLCCTCTLAMIAVDHFSAAVASQPSVHRLALCRRSVTGRGSPKAVHRPKDEENFSSLHQNATKGRHDTFSQQQRDFISHQRQYGTWLN